MEQHLNSVHLLVAKLRAIGEQISDSQVICVIFNSLPATYSNFIETQHRIDHGTPLAVQAVTAACLQEEQMLLLKHRHHTDQAHSTTTTTQTYS